ncbi:MAG: formate dehydrogenase subunit alpha [Nitrospinota bacterium]|nr:formate dehydrogenase subunit alpha [Nitrospinota bacterium]
MSVTLHIDGKEVEVSEGATLLDAAEKAGVYIPTLCHDPKLSPSGVCRLCVVEVEGAAGLLASCSTPVSAGMKALTTTPKVNQARKVTLELMLAGAGKLKASDYAGTEFGRILERYHVERSPFPARAAEGAVKMIRNPLFKADFSRCVLCRRCVRVCVEKMGYSAIGLVDKGSNSHIATTHPGGYNQSGCSFCGNCVQGCPSGALTENWRHLAKGAVRTAKTICTYCGTGCGLIVHVKDGRILGVEGDPENRVSHGDLCVKGRFAFDFVQHKDRLTTPMIRRKKGGRLVKASWEEALDLVADRLLAIKQAHGPGAIAGVSSSRCSNEENYIMAKLMRAAVGTNNIDNCARVCHAPSVAGLAAAFGSGAATNSLEEIEEANLLLVAGANVTEAHPVIGMKIKRALARGARLIVADPRRIELARMADIHLPLRPGTNIPLFNSMLHVIISEGLTDEEFIQQKTEGFDMARQSAEEWPPERAARVTGVKAELIRRAARCYATPKNAMILYGLGITEHVSGATNVKALANLALATGAVGRRGAGINPLRGQNNVQGACDMGALPNVHIAYQPVADDSVRAKFEQAYGVALPGQVGLKTTEYAGAIERGELKALIVMAMDPAQTDPNLEKIQAALKKLELLVVMEIFPTHTTALADVVLPGVSFAEKTGTFTNAERRVQLFHSVVEPLAGAMPEWRIVQELSGRLGYKMDYQTPEEIFNEISSLAGDFAGMDYHRLEREGGLCWPCPDKTHPGTSVMYQVSFPRGLARFSPIPHIPPNEAPDKEYPLTLVTGRRLEHYNNGSMTRRSPGLLRLSPEELVEIHPADGQKYEIRDGAWVQVVSRRGEVAARARLTERAFPGRVFMSFHFDDTLTNMVTSEGLDMAAGTPEYKVAAVRILAAKGPIKHKGRRS